MIAHYNYIETYVFKRTFALDDDKFANFKGKNAVNIKNLISQNFFQFFE